MNTLRIYNSLSKEKEEFVPISTPFVGMYVCGPTVYGEAHLGHARPYITFDLLNRFLKFLGYKVRYVRNITDVGHLVDDADEGEDKIAKKAKLEQLEPMEIAQLYTNDFHYAMQKLNTLPPSIEPLATGHILEQIELIESIIEARYGYIIDGSVYFDVHKYNENFQYGILSGRVLEELQDSGRTLDGQSEKRNKEDFALWKNASIEHIMQWKSPWGTGFPGWHIECSAMSSKYLGKYFDIHGGGMDLQFPHHEAEIAQSQIGNQHTPAKYWIHCNMLTLNGKKMGKSLGNTISLNQFFTGNHPLLSQRYDPMTIRFFILQGHYRSTLDFSNEALISSEKGLNRLLESVKNLEKVQYSVNSSWNISDWESNCFDALLDDLNSAILIAFLFEGVSKINLMIQGSETLTEPDLVKFKTVYKTLIFDILGLQESTQSQNSKEDGLMDIILNERKKAKDRKDFTSSDEIRDMLISLGIIIKDSKEGTSWSK